MNLGILIWPVPEVNGPEAVITPNSAEHLVVSSIHPKGIIVEENFFQCCGVFHASKVHSC